MEKNSVKTIEQLEALYSKPLAASVKKELPCLNEHYRKFILASPYLSLASVGPDGLDCSPRGDSPGFVSILDDKTLAIPDRRGNNRIDTLRNIVTDPRVALLFMIPGLNETIRINGQAYLTTDSQLMESFKVNEVCPVTAIIVNIEQVYFQCARALKRSSLWEPSLYVNPQSLPSAGTLINSAIKDFDAESYDSLLEERQAKTLW